MKYVLIEAIEREISTPSYYDSHENAHREMCLRFAEVMDDTIEAVTESYLEGEEYDDNAVILYDSAYCERHGNNFDWKIFPCLF